MTDFSQLSLETVPAYLAQRPALAGRIHTDAPLDVVEVGDGNLNLVFIVRDDEGASLVLKQSLPHVRTDPSWPMTRERSAREAVVLTAHEAADDAHVPALYDFDAQNYVLAIEDLSDHRVWRNELNEGRVHAFAAAEVGRYVARTAFHTSVFGLDPLEQKKLAARAINPELCQITEDLVFTEPYIEHEHNAVLPANEPDVAALRADRALLAEIGIAKYRFMTSAQSLIHGDLHTGSVFVREGAAGVDASVRAFDSEFGFFGPTGFDLGALWGNFVIAAARATALGDEERAALILTLPAELWNAFEAEFRSLWPSRIDPRVRRGVCSAQGVHSSSSVGGSARSRRCRQRPHRSSAQTPPASRSERPGGLDTPAPSSRGYSTNATHLLRRAVTRPTQHISFVARLLDQRNTSPSSRGYSTNATHLLRRAVTRPTQRVSFVA
jgi:5-methylthioribose kinase